MPCMVEQILFNALDVDGSGEVTLDELQLGLQVRKEMFFSPKCFPVAFHSVLCVVALQYR